MPNRLNAASLRRMLDIGIILCKYKLQFHSPFMICGEIMVLNSRQQIAFPDEPATRVIVWQTHCHRNMRWVNTFLIENAIKVNRLVTLTPEKL